MRILFLMVLTACSGNKDGAADTDTDTDTDTDFWSDWYAGYNLDMGLGYLEREGSRLDDGDPRFDALPAHFFVVDASYGPFSRNLVDFWGPKSSEPTPLVVYIHGGGFVTSDSDQVHTRYDTVGKLLQAGVAVASIQYRYAYGNSDTAINSGKPNDIGEDPETNGARLDVVLRDCARAIQYLRYRSEDLNIDTSRIGAWGNSAGGGCSTWVGTVPDLAQPEHEDPVLRESSRLQGVGHISSQVNYDVMTWYEHLRMEEDYVWERVGEEALRLTQLSKEDMLEEEGVALREVLNYYTHFDAGDPPFYSENSREDMGQEDDPDQSTMVHHPRGHVALYERCEEMGGRCEVKTRIYNSDYKGDVNDFMIEILSD